MGKRRKKLLFFSNFFGDLPDPRQPGKVIYPLPEVLLLCLLAVLSGAEDFVTIARWGQGRINFLRRFLPFKDGTPSHDQLGDIFATLDATISQRCFVAWVASITGVPADVITLDGKTSRRSADKRKGKAAIHMVSAFAARQRLVLGQVKVADKSNEIIAIPALLGMLAIEGAVVTIDAMGCSATSPRKSSMRRPTTSSPSRVTRAPCGRTSRCSRPSRRQTASRTPRCEPGSANGVRHVVGAHRISAGPNCPAPPPGCTCWKEGLSLCLEEMRPRA